MRKYLYVMKKAGGSEYTIISRSFYEGRSGLRVPQLRKRPRRCSMSAICAKIVIIIINMLLPKSCRDNIKFKYH